MLREKRKLVFGGDERMCHMTPMSHIRITVEGHDVEDRRGNPKMPFGFGV